jgi:hypothetical protein
LHELNEDGRVEKSPFDPDKYPPQPSPRKVIMGVILFHLMIIGWVALIIISDGEILGNPYTRSYDWLDNLLDGL